jgi:hypothetical protein
MDFIILIFPLIFNDQKIITRKIINTRRVRNFVRKLLEDFGGDFVETVFKYRFFFSVVEFIDFLYDYTIQYVLIPKGNLIIGRLFEIDLPNHSVSLNVFLIKIIVSISIEVKNVSTLSMKMSTVNIIYK